MTTRSISISEPPPFEDLLSLKGCYAVVTGGSRGLGEAIVQRLSQAGAAVVLTGRGLKALQSVESQINAAGGQALGAQADMASLKDSKYPFAPEEMDRWDRRGHLARIGKAGITTAGVNT